MRAIYDLENSQVILEDRSKVCFNTHDITAEVINEVIRIFNTGGGLNEIDVYLLDAACSSDVRETIVEGFYQIYFSK